MSLAACATLLLQTLLAADVVVTAAAPLDGERLADALRTYLPEYGVRVQPDRAGVARDARGQLAEARRVGEALRAAAVVRAEPASSERIELNLVDMATQQSVVVSVARPDRDADLYRALALKIHALLRSTSNTAAPAPRAVESAPPPRRVSGGVGMGQAANSASSSSQTPSPPLAPAPTSSSSASASVSASAPPPPAPARSSQSAYASPAPSRSPSPSSPSPSPSPSQVVEAAPRPREGSATPASLSLQTGYVVFSFPLTGPALQGLSLTGMFAARPWLDLSLGGAVLSSTRAEEASPTGFVTAVASLIPITAAARLRLMGPRYEFLIGPTAEVAIASVATSADAETPVRSARNVMFAAGAEAEGRVRLGAAMWLYGRVAGLGVLLGQRYKIAGKPVIDMSRLEVTAGLGVGFELR